MAELRIPAALPGIMHSLLRAMTGLLFMQHGLQKLFGYLFAAGPGPYSVDALLRGRRGVAPEPAGAR